MSEELIIPDCPICTALIAQLLEAGYDLTSRLELPTVMLDLTYRRKFIGTITLDKHTNQVNFSSFLRVLDGGGRMLAMRPDLNLADPDSIEILLQQVRSTALDMELSQQVRSQQWQRVQ